MDGIEVKELGHIEAHHAPGSPVRVLGPSFGNLEAWLPGVVAQITPTADGYTVDVVGSGRAAGRRWFSQKPGAVVADDFEPRAA